MIKLNLKKYKFLYLAIFSIAIFLNYFIPEKSLNEKTQIIPQRWISETVLKVEESGQSRFFDVETGKYTNDTTLEDVWEKKPVIKQWMGRAVNRSDSSKYDAIFVDGFETEVFPPSENLRQRVFNGIKYGNSTIPFPTFLSDDYVGIVSLEKGVASPVKLPKMVKNIAAPIVIWDHHSGGYFAYQPLCFSGIDRCQRNAWILSDRLKLIKSFKLPPQDLLNLTERTYRCFSCGCGCYSSESVYFVAGRVFFLISGFPIKDDVKGLHEVIINEDGSSEWLQVINDRMEGPITFSPSGCQVAYYKVSYLGNELITKNICR